MRQQRRKSPRSKTGSRPVTARGDASRESILAAAIGLLGSGGYGALSVGAVCRIADISATSLYWHFGDKSGLMSAMVRHVQRLDSDTYLAELGKARTVEEKFTAGIDTLRSMVLRDPMNTWVVTAALWEGRYAAPQIVALVTEARRRQHDYFRDIATEHFGLPRGHTLAYISAAFSAHAAMSWHQTKDERELESILGSLRSLWTLGGSWAALPVAQRRRIARIPAAAAFGLSHLTQGMD